MSYDFIDRFTINTRKIFWVAVVVGLLLLGVGIAIGFLIFG